MENTASLRIKLQNKLDELCKCTRGANIPARAVVLTVDLIGIAECLHAQTAKDYDAQQS